MVGVHQNCRLGLIELICRGSYFKMQVQVHNVQDQMQLVKIDLELQQIKSLSRHSNPKLLRHEFADFWIAHSRYVVHCLKYKHLLSMLLSEFLFALFEKFECLGLFLTDHVQEETNKDREDALLQIMLKLVK